MQSSFQKQYIHLNSEMVADVMLKSEQEAPHHNTALEAGPQLWAQGPVSALEVCSPAP